MFEELFGTGDWQRDLLREVRVAEESANSPRIREAVALLKEVLLEVDECIHTVTISQPVPTGWDAQFLITHLRNECDDAQINLANSGEITLIFTRRGSLSYVENSVNDDVRRALAAVRQIAHRALSPG